MKKIRKHLPTCLVVLISSIILVSCCRTDDCSPSVLRPVFVSFDSTEMDTLVYLKFKIGSNFNNPIDSVFVPRSEYLFPYTQGDSVYLSEPRNFSFEYGYEYEVVVPGASRVFKIKDIKEQKTTHEVCILHDGPQECANPVLSYLVDAEVRTQEYMFLKK